MFNLELFKNLKFSPKSEEEEEQEGQRLSFSNKNYQRSSKEGEFTFVEDAYFYETNDVFFFFFIECIWYCNY